MSLTSNVAKVLERVLKVRIQSESDALRIIPDRQMGFRPGYSSVHPLIAVSSVIANALNACEPVIALSLDFEKAFDAVWSAGLIYKLHHAGISYPLTRMILSFLRNRMLAVDIEGTISPWRMIAAGVPQGCVLSPLLYAIFTSDMPAPNG